MEKPSDKIEMIPLTKEQVETMRQTTEGRISLLEIVVYNLSSLIQHYGHIMEYYGLQNVEHYEEIQKHCKKAIELIQKDVDQGEEWKRGTDDENQIG